MKRRSSKKSSSLFIVMAAAAMCVVLATAPRSSAILLYYDPFLLGDSEEGSDPEVVEPQYGEYAVGVIAGQDPTVPSSPNPPAGPWGTDPTFFDSPWYAPDATAPNGNVVAEGLFYIDAPSLGGALSAQPDTRARRAVSMPWDQTTAGTYYMSFLINYGSISGTDMGYRSVEIGVGDGGSAIYLGYNAYYSTIGPQQQNPNTARMFLGTGGGGITTQEVIIPNSPPSFNADNSIHLVVLRFDMTTSGDTLSLYLDPTILSEPGVPEASRTGMDFLFGNMGIALYGGFGPDSPTLDELRIGTTFADVMPELGRPGDTDGDDDTDLIDLATIVANWGLNVGTCGPSCGDVANALAGQGTDKYVGIADFRLWKDWRNVFEGTGSAANSVDSHAPEPSSLVLALAAMMALASCARQKC